jgi:hypothetical protein
VEPIGEVADRNVGDPSATEFVLQTFPDGLFYHLRPLESSDPNRPNCPICGTAMSILRYANPPNDPDGVAYHCPRHGRFWLENGQLRQEDPRPQHIEG